MWLYRNNADNSARYVLGEPGKRNLACIGINPSTATPEKLDPTLRQVKCRAEQYGYDGWIMFNVYPQRATNPDGLDVNYNWYEHSNNIDAIYQTLNDWNCDIWSAWGTLITKRPYLKECLKGIVVVSRGSWYTVGPRSKEGHPHHPLYLRKEYKLEPFDVWKYVGRLR